MITRILNEGSVKELWRMLKSCRRIVITCHVKPDGDAIGSSLGLYHVLSALGKEVRVVTPDMPPKNLMFLPGAKDIVVATRYEEFARKLFADADLVFCLDFNAPYRVDRMQRMLLDSVAPKVMIDHHLSPDPFTTLSFSHPEVSSTSMLVFRLVCRLELFQLIDKNAAKCIYTGMMTDTGNFSYNSNDPDLYIVIAELLRKGIDKDEIYRRVFNTNSASRLRLNGYAIYRKMIIFPEHRAALITLDARELDEFGYEKGDTESLVNVPLSIPEITYCAFMRQDPGYIKVSTRSKGSFPVNRLCEEHFNGGGHLNAAGGEFKGTMQECVDRFISVLPDYDKYL